MNNMRERPRIDINHMISCTCHDENGTTTPVGRAMIVNISTTGALIETKDPIPSKHLTLCNQSFDDLLCVKGKIVHITKNKSRGNIIYGPYRTGIFFTDLPSKSKDFIISIVKPGEKKTTEVPAIENTGEFDTLDFKKPALNISVRPGETSHGPDHYIDEGTNVSLSAPPPEIMNAPEDKSEDALESIEDLLQEEQKKQSPQKHETTTPISDLVSLPSEPDSDQYTTGGDSRWSTPDGYNKRRKLIFNIKTATTKPFVYFSAANFTITVLIVCMALAGSHVSFFGEKRWNWLGSLQIEFPFITSPQAHHQKTGVNGKKKIIQKNRVYLVSSSIENRFVRNVSTGPVFVIRGIVSNFSVQGTKNIQVTGKIFDAQNRLLDQSTVYAGQNLTDAQLIHIDNETLTELLQSTPAIKASEKLPFLVTFTNVSENFQRFTLDIEK